MLCRCATLFALLLLLSCDRFTPTVTQEYPTYLYVYNADGMQLSDSVLAYFVDSSHLYLLAEKTFNAHKAKDSIECIQAQSFCLKMLKLQHQKFGVVIYPDSVMSIYRAANDGFHFVSTVACRLSSVTRIVAKDVNGDGNKDLVIADLEGAHGNEYTEVFLFDAASQNLRYLRTGKEVSLENIEPDNKRGYLRSKHYRSTQGSNVKTIYKIEHDSLVVYQSVSIHPTYKDDRFVLGKTKGGVRTEDTVTAQQAWKIFSTSYWDTRNNW